MLKILKTFYKFLLVKKGYFIGFCILLVISALLRSITPLFYKWFVDAIPSSTFEVLLNILIVYTIFNVVSLLVSVATNYLGDFSLIDGSAKARSSIFKYLQDLDFAFHTSKSTGSLISAMKRGDGAFFTLHFVIHFQIIPILINFLVMIWFFSAIDPRITIYVSATFVLVLWLARLLITKNMRARLEFNQKEDDISGIIVDNTINYDTVKLFAQEEWEHQRLNRSFGGWKRYLWKYANSFRFIDVSIGLLINLSIFVIFYVTLKLSKTANFNLGDFVLVVGFANTFYPRLFDLVYGFRDIAKHYADIQKYFGILDTQIEIIDPKDPVEIDSVKGNINFENVSFSYKDGKKNALKGINLKIKKGQSVALVGRSGSGKTTLVRLLLRFFDVDSGSVTIDGIDVKSCKKADLRSFIGVVPQEPILFNNSIKFNIAYGRQKATSGEIVQASKLANIHDFIQSLPDQYNTQVGERGVKLSGGQKQRLAIARMILSNPDIIIFDEATSQLDSESERLIQDALWQVSKGKTTIIIAHRLSTAMRANRTIVLEDGKIVESGSHKGLLRRKNSTYAKFWNLQTNFDY